jgi:hypothetical protein
MATAANKNTLTSYCTICDHAMLLGPAPSARCGEDVHEVVCDTCHALHVFQCKDPKCHTEGEPTKTTAEDRRVAAENRRVAKILQSTSCTAKGDTAQLLVALYTVSIASTGRVAMVGDADRARQYTEDAWEWARRAHKYKWQARNAAQAEWASTVADDEFATWLMAMPASVEDSLDEDDSGDECNDAPPVGELCNALTLPPQLAHWCLPPHTTSAVWDKMGSEHMQLLRAHTVRTMMARARMAEDSPRTAVAHDVLARMEAVVAQKRR